eukprot:8310714-Alexandrium_andersonii.AAC.1
MPPGTPNWRPQRSRPHGGVAAPGPPKPEAPVQEGREAAAAPMGLPAPEPPLGEARGAVAFSVRKRCQRCQHSSGASVASVAGGFGCLRYGGLGGRLGA